MGIFRLTYSPPNKRLLSPHCIRLGPPLRAGPKIRRYVPKCILGMVVCVISMKALADLSWFESKWVSDTEMTVSGEKWEELEELDASSYEKLKALYGKLEWHVQGGVIEVRHPTHPIAITTYSYRPTVTGGIELLLADGSIIEVSRTKNGFCINLGYDSYLSRECFKQLRI